MHDFRNLKLMLSALFLMILTGCLEKLDPDDVKTVKYSYQDSSVPPPYHRSFDITVEPDKAHIQVDSYGDILVDSTFSITTTAFENLIFTINNANLQSGEAKAGQGCTGGTSERLSITSTDKKVYEGRFEHCGGNRIPARLGDYEKVVLEIKKLIPNLNHLLK